MPEALINEFVKIIYDYVKHGKMVDEKFYRNIYQLFSVSIYGRKLEKFVYIDEISRYDDENEKYTKRLESIIGLAAYNSKEKELIVYQDNLDRESQCITMKQSLNDRNSIILYNLLCLQSLLHEYEHIIQEYKEFNCNDFESQMLRFVGRREETTKSYEYSMRERLAELNSLRNIMFIMEKLNIKSNKIFEYFSNRIVETQRKGYNIVVDNFKSPIEKYLELHNDKPYKVFQIKVEDIDTIILFGLPIDLDTYVSYLNSEKKEIQKVYR